MSDEFQSYVVQRDGDTNLKFRGVVLANVYTSTDKAHPHFSGSVGRSTELTLYRTAKGKYVCASIGESRWQGERTRYAGHVYTNIEDVKLFFGHDRLAKRLYEAAGIEDAEEIE